MYLEITRVNNTGDSEFFVRELVLFGPGGADEIYPADNGKRCRVSFPNGSTFTFNEPYEVIKKALSQYITVVSVDYEKPVELKAIKL